MLVFTQHVPRVAPLTTVPAEVHDEFAAVHAQVSRVGGVAPFENDGPFEHVLPAPPSAPYVKQVELSSQTLLLVLQWRPDAQVHAICWPVHGSVIGAQEFVGQAAAVSGVQQ